MKLEDMSHGGLIDLARSLEISIEKLEHKLDIAKDTLSYITMEAFGNDYQNQRLFDITKAKEALKKLEEY